MGNQGFRARKRWYVGLPSVVLALSLFPAAARGTLPHFEGLIDHLSGSLVADSGGSSFLSRRDVIGEIVKSGSGSDPALSNEGGSAAFSLPGSGRELFTDDYLAQPARPNPFFSSASVLGALLAVILLIAYLARTRYALLKRTLDVVGAIIALVVLLPLVAAAAVLIKLDSPGPVFLRQTRVGINRRHWTRRTSARNKDRRRQRNGGSLFTIYKLRTMRADAEAKTGPVWAKANDDRITRVGRFLRKTRIDEIPQFWNVLKGDMCIIGPRPERPIFINQLNKTLRDYQLRLNVKPGITGLAQVRYTYAASVEDSKKKLRYDLLYVRKMCLSMDVRILFNTFNTVIFTRGAR